MTVPFLDLRAAQSEIAAELEAAVQRVVASGYYIMGPELDRFEAEFAAYCGCPHAVGLGNGLDALRLGLQALGIGPGDEVIVPSNTYIATWLAVSQCGARPVPVEPIEKTHNIDPTGVAAAITPTTRAILPVHLYGQPADLDPLRDLAREHGLALLEDGAQAHGAHYKGERIGKRGHFAWSFYPAKNLGAFGDGGALTTYDHAVADQVRLLRNYGSRVKYENEVAGLNSRLDPLQAAVLSVKLTVLDRWTARRKEIARRYSDGLAGAGVILPHVPNWADPVWHLYVVRHPERDAFQGRLKEAGIGTVIHYPIPPHMQGAYAEAGYKKGAFPLAEKLAQEVISLPMCPSLNDAQVDEVIAQVTALA